MFKIILELMVVLLISYNTFSETKTNERVLIPKLYLEYKYSGVSYNAQGGYSIIRKPYYSFDPSYIDQKVNFFGRNLAKEMEPVPQAKKIMNGYMINKIGVITCVVASLGTIVLSAVNNAEKSEKKPDGTYDTKVPAGIPVGFGIMGLGIVLNCTSPIYLRVAVKEYNKHASRIY